MMYDISEQYATNTTTLVFKFPLGLVYDKYYPLHTKTTLVCFSFSYC